MNEAITIALALLLGKSIFGKDKPSSSFKKTLRSSAKDLSKFKEVSKQVNVQNVSRLGGVKIPSTVFQNIFNSDSFVYTGVTAENLKIQFPAPQMRFLRPTIEIKQGESEEDKYGGIDLEINLGSPILDTQHDPAFPHYLSLRPKKLENEMPVLIGFKNRMPRDTGHINRRHWITNPKIKHPNGRIETWYIHDEYKENENRSNFHYVISQDLLEKQFTRLKKGIGESICRRNGGGVEGLLHTPYSWTECEIPHIEEDTGGLVTYRCLSDLCLVLCCEPEFTILIKNSHKSKPYNLTSAFHVLYNYPAFLWVLKDANKAWKKYLSIVGSLVKSISSMVGSEIAGTAFGNIIQTIVGYAQYAYKLAISVNDMVNVFKGKTAKHRQDKIDKYKSAWSYYGNLILDELISEEANNSYVSFMASVSKITIILPKVY